MNIRWETKHDPLQLLKARGPLNRFEVDAREQGEDIIWIESSGRKKCSIDLGWYRDRYIVYQVGAKGWDAPLQQIECHDLESAMNTLRNLAEA